MDSRQEELLASDEQLDLKSARIIPIGRAHVTAQAISLSELEVYVFLLQKADERSCINVSLRRAVVLFNQHRVEYVDLKAFSRRCVKLREKKLVTGKFQTGDLKVLQLKLACYAC